MKLPLKCCMFVFLLGVVFGAQNVQAQFRNHGLYLPSVGWTAFGNSANALNGTEKQKWAVTDHWTLGTGFFTAIGYQLWWDNQTFLGFGKSLLMGEDKTVISLSISTGLRYNFLKHKHRPFVNGHFHYLQFFNTDQEDASLFLGLRPGAGYEFFIGNETSLMGEVNYILFVNMDQPPRHSMASRLSFNIYF